MEELDVHDLAEHQQQQVAVAAVIRCLLSSQSWLRMREEFGLAGTESGLTVVWVIEVLLEHLEKGNGPLLGSEPASPPEPAAALTKR